MTYGLIGEKLHYSLSPKIHALLGCSDYEAVELAEESLETFFAKKEFLGVNVTIPYKKSVIRFLDELEEGAAEIGSVNTVLNRAGKRIGYNTDFDGLRALILRHVPSLLGKTVLILGGDGGTARTAKAVAKSLGAEKILSVSRTKKEGVLDYSELNGVSADVLINATPNGMNPCDKPLVDVKKIQGLALVIDAVYAPLRTRLILSAREAGIAAEGGLFMLVSQAAKAHGIFCGEAVTAERIEGIYQKILANVQNTVLVGMPGCGKTTVGKALSASMGKPFFDTDEVIVKKAGKSIPQLFDEVGERGFRALETEAILELSEKSGCVIATGGGSVLQEENLRLLKQNGKIVYLDRPVSKLPTGGERPLSKDADALQKLYDVRRGIYEKAADVTVTADGTTMEIAKKIAEENQ